MVNPMKKVYLYGAGFVGRDLYDDIKDCYEIKGWLDSNPIKWGTTVNNLPVLGGADVVSNLDYDEIITSSLTGSDAIREALLGEGVPLEKINTLYMDISIQARINFLRDFVNLRKNDIRDLSVAEGGVFQGEFAKIINATFPDSKLYLFDTFEGFNIQDMQKDKTEGYSEPELETFLADTCVDLVLSKLPHPENAVIMKGYFPETAKGLEDERFFFVNLDFDLYQPILEGLKFFYPRLSNKGVLVVHDFFNPGFLGVSQAVRDFEKEIGKELIKLPIGDHYSIAIVKS